jgi:hypothetical protein
MRLRNRVPKYECDGPFRDKVGPERSEFVLYFTAFQSPEPEPVKERTGAQP